MKVSAVTTRQLKRSFVCVSLITTLLISIQCNKGPDSPPNNNEFNALVVLANGTQVNINAKGTKATMGCASLGGGTYVNGVNSNNAAVYISLYASGVMCVTKTGTYPFQCQYRPNIASQVSPIYENIGVSNPGSITFTSITDKTMEGFFNAVCRYNVDSVVVTGTFKADRLTN